MKTKLAVFSCLVSFLVHSEAYAIDYITVMPPDCWDECADYFNGLYQWCWKNGGYPTFGFPIYPPDGGRGYYEFVCSFPTEEETFIEAS